MEKGMRLTEQELIKFKQFVITARSAAEELLQREKQIKGLVDVMEELCVEFEDGLTAREVNFGTGLVLGIMDYHHAAGTWIERTPDACTKLEQWVDDLLERARS